MTTNFSVKTEFNAVDHMSSKIRRMESSVGRFTSKAISGLGKLQNVTGKIDSAIKQVGTTFTALGTVAGFAAKSVISAGADFDQQMATLSAVSLKTRDQIKPLEALAEQLGASTQFTATQVGKGMEFMLRAGFEMEDVMKGVPGVLAAAAAEGMELGDASNHISNVLKGMGLETSKASHVANVLALASARTNSSIASLGESMANVASTARTFNIPLESVVASVASLQDVGLDASVAGSAMNTMLTQLAKPTEAMVSKMRKFGVTFKTAEGNMLPLNEVLANLSKAAEKSGGNMEQVAFFADLVGLRGQKAAQNLADMIKPGIDGTSKLTKLMNELSRASDGVGAAFEMQQKRQDSFKGDMDRLGSAIESVKTDIFNLNKGPLRNLVQGMNKWIEANDKLIVSKVQEHVQWTIDHFDELTHRLKQIGKGVVAFYALHTGIKVAKFGFEAFELTMKAWPLVAKTAAFSTKLLGAEVQGFGLKTATATTQVEAFQTRTALATKSVGKLQGSLSLLGGVATAAFAGWGIGRVISDVFDLDKKISDILLKLQGIKPTERGGKDGLDPSEGKVFGVGSLRTTEFVAKHGMRGTAIVPVKEPSFVGFPSVFGHHPVTPLSGLPVENVGLKNPRTQAQQNTLELVIHDKSGSVEVKRKPKIEGVNVRLKPSGAF